MILTLAGQETRAVHMPGAPRRPTQTSGWSWFTSSCMCSAPLILLVSYNTSCKAHVTFGTTALTGPSRGRRKLRISVSARAPVSSVRPSTQRPSIPASILLFRSECRCGDVGDEEGGGRPEASSIDAATPPMQVEVDSRDLNSATNSQQISVPILHLSTLSSWTPRPSSARRRRLPRFNTRTRATMRQDSCAASCALCQVSSALPSPSTLTASLFAYLMAALCPPKR